MNAFPPSADRSVGRGHGPGGLLSVVIPCHDEAAVIDNTHARLTAALPAVVVAVTAVVMMAR